MLSRTANHLYWLGRYLERAETTARLLEVGGRNALLPNLSGGHRNEWEAVLQANNGLEAFRAKYSDPSQRNIETFLFFDRDNPSSIASCINLVRENARVVRTALTMRVWDAINSCYQELQEMSRTERSQISLTDLTDWTMRTCAEIRGAIEATQLRNDGYHFLNVGYAIERADNTARLLNVKYYVLLPSVQYVGSGLDNYQWVTLLRSMSAHRAFIWTYDGEVTPAKIAHFLILNRLFPRSLLTSMEMASDHLDHLARGYGRGTEAQQRIRNIVAELAELQVEDVFDEGLHEFLLRFIADNAALAGCVEEVYLQGEAA
ncbi:Uncharacterized conserved protein, Alpha-E superfamily [Poseidonocella pacifica]|uniref:Uncharacterized conserved protein, Alpha-E superfamily n=1 Tax=Poseidonocella pacifica TaxID=871651 RepID=A0A1I0WH68_9RHOB|nr:alpha-E domain-containing protein [Poseidonocella pacifica]SFA87286.1 Uncharacterized conserved protein, Alpha-E superfamily [Poseidonocella pacifica]